MGSENYNNDFKEVKDVFFNRMRGKLVKLLDFDGYCIGYYMRGQIGEGKLLNYISFNRYYTDERPWMNQRYVKYCTLKHFVKSVGKADFKRHVKEVEDSQVYGIVRNEWKFSGCVFPRGGNGYFECIQGCELTDEMPTVQYIMKSYNSYQKYYKGSGIRNYFLMNEPVCNADTDDNGNV